ncbi:MAG: Ig-like domain-containing protein, partial [Bacteroidota bacterium]
SWVNGDDRIGVTGDNVLLYTPLSESFTGLDTMKVGYWKFTERGPEYTQRFLHINVVPSQVVANDDYAATDINQTITIDVLANDHGNSEILAIKAPVLMTNNGVARVTNDGKIAFTPRAGFEGVANLNYIACDELNTCDLATVSVCVFNSLTPASDTLRIITEMNTPEVVLLPVNGYNMISAPQSGQYDVSGEVALYVPNNNFVGTDEFSFEKMINGRLIEKTVVVDVIEATADNEFAADDYFFTTTGTATEGNVLLNDVGGADLRYPTITRNARNGSATLNNRGELFYTPRAGFEGIERIEYKVMAGNSGVEEKATAFVFVSDQEPVATTFELTTPKNVPLVLNYGATVNYWGFRKTTLPNRGQLELGEINGNYYGHDIKGNNLIVYVPSQNITGYDEFEIAYCVTESDCHPIKLKVDILDIEVPEDHACVARQCIWAGDTNNDGIVNMQDLLPIGLGMGEVGTERDNPDLNNWYGQYGEDWTGTLAGAGLDIKYIDTDGNGVVSAVDTAAISDFYGNVHSIIPETPNLNVETPLFFGRPDTIPLVGLGAIIELPIMLGAPNYPANDIYGFTFDVDFSGSSQVIDLESVQLEFAEDSWMAYNSPVLDMQREVVKGKIEAGYTRTNGVVSSGYGLIGAVKFVIVDDIDGIRLNDTQFSIQIN